MKPLLVDGSMNTDSKPAPGVFEAFFLSNFKGNAEFYMQATKLIFCFCGLQASYLLWGYYQVRL
jgi:hypothetical protein